jgi:hypothetical protein
VQLSTEGTLSSVRKDAEEQLKQNGIKEQWLRQWLLMNVVERDGKARWAINIDAIFTAYVNRFGKNFSTHNRVH